MKIDFKNYGKENNPIFKKALLNIAKVLKLESEYEHKKYIQEFEREFAVYNDSKYTIGLNSGTASLELSLQANKISKSDEVLLPSYTYISTALAVSNLGAKPVFIDIKGDTLTINAEKIEPNITKKTKAIIVVHIHGNPCDMDKILPIAKKHKLLVIEDASHASGAEYKGIKTGNLGIGCFSCQTTKILSGIGNSGLITTNDRQLYEKILQITEVNNDPCLDICKRTPCRINAIQAAILQTKFTFLETMIKIKRRNASIYKNNLQAYIKYQKEEKNSKAVYRDFLALTKQRDKVIANLLQSGIEAKISYEIPLHLTNFYKYLKYKKGDLPITEKVCETAICLPISYTLSEKDIKFICSQIKQ